MLQLSQVSILGLMDLGFRQAFNYSAGFSRQVSILGLMDLGFRQREQVRILSSSFVSILGLMDLGFRQMKAPTKTQMNCCFNPWFNGFRF